MTHAQQADFAAEQFGAVEQAIEKEVEAGGALDQYEVEGPDRAEMLQNLGELQLATVIPRCSEAPCLTWV